MAHVSRQPAPPASHKISMQPSYSQHSSPQALAFRPAIPLFPDLSTYQSVTVADYGCASATNTIAPFSALLKTLPPGSTVTLLFNDTVWNDWTAVARNVRNRMEELSRDGELKVRILLSPMSFYEQVVQEDSVDLGCSWSSWHYLESYLPISSDSAERMRKKAEQAHIGLVKLLGLRAAEIKSGGYFIAALVSTERPQPPSGTTSSSPESDRQTPNNPPILYALQKALATMTAKGVLTQAQADAMSNIPIHLRTEDEVRAACTAPELETLWHLDSLTSSYIPHPAWTKLSQKDVEARTEEDKQVYAEELVSWAFVVLKEYFAQGIRMGVERGEGAEEGPTEEEEQVLAELREEMKGVLRSECADWAAGVLYLYVRLRRKERVVL